MTEQAQLFDVPDAAPALNARQQLALEEITRTGGLTADEIGAVAHTIPGPRSTYSHAADVRCTWCGKAGREIGDKLVELGLVRRRKGDPGMGLVYVPVNAAVNEAGPERAPAGGPHALYNVFPEEF